MENHLMTKLKITSTTILQLLKENLWELIN
jgi:hypothetical protein